LSIDRLTPQLDAGQPEVRAHARLDGPEFKGNTP
jgi:hypothetical protein